MNRQFDTAPLICPHCGHVIGEQAYFQSFEVKVASWLNAKVAPPATKGYDVCDSELVPGKTFQVKYSSIYKFQPKNRNHPDVAWGWTVKNLDDIHPDFFVLFGIDEDGAEHCFLFSRDDFLRSANYAKDGRYYLRVTAKKQSDRANYRYIPKIWRYVVLNPVQSLADHILNYEPKTQKTMRMEEHAQLRDRMRALRDAGLTQKQIAKQFDISQRTVSRILRGVR